VANQLKHLVLTQPPRSGHRCKLGRVKYEIPQSSFKSLTFGNHSVEFDINDPENLTLTMAIEDEHGVVIGDAF
jgi:hypothetical protein